MDEELNLSSVVLIAEGEALLVDEGDGQVRGELYLSMSPVYPSSLPHQSPVKNDLLSTILHDVVSVLILNDQDGPGFFHRKAPEELGATGYRDDEVMDQSGLEALGHACHNSMRPPAPEASY